jgi:hypothetical protein
MSCHKFMNPGPLEVSTHGGLPWFEEFTSVDLDRPGGLSYQLT